jgi:hypothetical protein
MAMIYPKFDQKINDQITAKKFEQTRTRPGVVISYDKSTNTATVLLDEKYAGTVGDIVNNVPCPFNYGIQTVAPHGGLRCLVGFRSDSERDPYILTFFMDPYDTAKNMNNSVSDTGIPKFMV